MMSAYACEPGKGSEPEVGWQWALQMSRFHDVTVLTRTNNRRRIEAELPRLKDRPVPQFLYHDLGPLLLQLKNRIGTRPYYILWQRATRQLLAGHFRANKFDLIHHVTFASFRYPSNIWGHGVPCIWGPVGGIESIPAALLPWRYPGPLFSEVLRNLDNLMQTTTLGVLRMRALRSNLVLVSTREMQTAFAGVGIQSTLMPTIGLHTRDFPVPQRSVHRDPLRLLYVGNLLPLKGLDFAIRALKASGTNARLTLIGSGPFRTHLEQLAGRLGLQDRVEFLGRVPREQALAAYQSYDVFLFPSLHDTGGYALIEAMANAMPVICLKTGGPETAVLDGCGIRVPLGSPRTVVNGLAEAIRRYDQNRERVVADGLTGRRAVDANYDWGHKGQLMSEYYQQVTRKARSSARNKAP